MGQVEESRDGSNSPVTSHQMRKHLSTMSRGWGSVPHLEPKESCAVASGGMFDREPQNEAAAANLIEISDRQLLYRAAAQAVPRDFNSGDSVTLQSGSAPRWLGTRNDQGRSIQQMTTLSRSSAPRRTGLSTTNLPHTAVNSACRQLDNYAESSQLPIRYQPPIHAQTKSTFENYV